ncbi:MAG: GDSL-type esterase/lipase family protein [Siculibacillus sp.]|nr:GDSL-type esterase/lipase family protein [Siculibacillus sp.]
MRIGRTAIVFLTAMVFATLAAAPAAAQHDPIGGFFRALFGVPQRQQVPSAIDPLAQPKKRVEPKIVEVPKIPDAQVVLVIGDIEAQGLGYGLQMAFSEDPTIAILSKSRNASGLTRESEGEWSTLATKVLAENKADFVVVMVGVNDYQTIPVPGAKGLEAGGEEWTKIYGERLDRLIAQIRATGKPFWWVGLPPTADPDRKPTARAAYAAFLSSLNDMARPRVQAAGGGFVDIWNAFTDEAGFYASTGPDVEGQIKKLRTNDGVLFTRAGQRKLAFFVEQEIRKVMRGGGIPSLLTLPEEPRAEPRPEEAIVGGPPPLPPAPWTVVGPIVPLGRAAGPDGDGGLAGAPGRTRAAEYLPGGFPIVSTPAHRRLVDGLPIEAPAGRVDDISRRVP